MKDAIQMYENELISTAEYFDKLFPPQILTISIFSYFGLKQFSAHNNHKGQQQKIIAEKKRKNIRKRKHVNKKSTYVTFGRKEHLVPRILMLI